MTISYAAGRSCLTNILPCSRGESPMTGTSRSWLALTTLVLSALSGGSLQAGDLYQKGQAPAQPVALPSPSQVRTLQVHPGKLELQGGDDAQQLILTAVLTDGRLQDLTGDAKFEVLDP